MSMPKSQRLIQMMMSINAKKAFTVRELADEFGLSVRTAARDLRELSELGVPVYSVQGRGGGYRLLRERLLPPIAFTENEAVAMFVAGQSLGHLGALPFEEGTEAALRKFYHYMPEDVRGRIDRLKDRVAIWSPRRDMSPDVLKTLLQGIMAKSAVSIAYESSGGAKPRDIQPIGLFESDGYWYCPAYCFRAQAYRLFRADRIRRAELAPELPCREDVGSRTLWNVPENKSAERISFTVELTARGVRELRSDPAFGPAISTRADGSGTAALTISADTLDFYSDIAWRLGEDAKVTEPREAIDRIRRKLEAMRSVYG